MIDYASRIYALVDTDLERLIDDWIASKRSDYPDSDRLSGAGDMGRDVVGFHTAKRFDGPWDNYQCKQLRRSLGEPEMLRELAKMVFHSAAGHFELPDNYVFVAPKGAVRAVRDLISHPSRIAPRLREQWDTWCAGHMVKDETHPLAPEPIQPLVPFETPVVERRLVEPIATAEAIAEVIGDLVDDMVEMLEQRGLGLRAAALACVRVDAAEQIVPLGTSRATRDAKHIKRMFALRIERIEPGLGIEAMRLAAPQVEPLGATTIASDLIPGDRPPDIAPLVDQLAGRVGDAALFRLTAIESDVPERAVRALAPLSEPQGWPKWKRPTRLLVRPEHLHGVVALLPDHPPRRFTWRGKPYRVVGGDGPERIHGEWWKNGREMWAVRDYFKVEADSGERFWIFRRGDGVEAETGDLSWYMHGVFG